MTIDISFQGLEEYKTRIKQAPQKASTAAEAAMKTFVLKVSTDVKKSLNIKESDEIGYIPSLPFTPPNKRTGHLYQSVYNKINKLGAMIIQGLVGDNAEYGVHLEYGTSKMPPRPYLRPVVESNKNYFVKLFKIIFDKL